MNSSKELTMKSIRTLILISALPVMSMACAWNEESGTEADFGNSVRQMIAEQTANPNPQAAAEEAGDGPRLEAVIEAYRTDAGSRAAIDRAIDIDPSSTGSGN
jgi:citrate lyase gamma subunit